MEAGPVGTSTRPLVVVVDSARGGYVAEPDVERAVLEPLARVELQRREEGGRLGPPAEEAEILIAWHHIALPAQVLRALPRCRGIVRASVGYDNIDLAAARELGIPVCNVPDYGTEEVADHAMALLLTLVRRLPALDAHVRGGGWDWRAAGGVNRLRGSTLGIVGLGRIGLAVARRAQAFGLDVAFYDPYVPSGVEKSTALVRCEELNELIDRSWILSLHAPLTAETSRMIGRAELGRMRPDGILLNTARGDLVDSRALVEALEGGRLGGAGLDVLSGEPTVPEEVRVSGRVLLTPHAAFYSDASLLELRRKAAETGRRLLLGQPVRTILNDVQPAPHRDVYRMEKSQ
jgi:C-terminal binding protein